MENLHCFHTPKYVFSIEGIKYYSASNEGVGEFNRHLVVNLTGKSNVPRLGIPELDQHVESKYQELVLSWPDFSTPRVKPSFWRAFQDYVVKQGYSEVCIHCAAGHGRTGTMLASLLIALSAYCVIDAIKTVREKHCPFAIETEEQIDYLYNLDLILNGKATNKESLPLPGSLINPVNKTTSSKYLSSWWQDYEIYK